MFFGLFPGGFGIKGYELPAAKWGWGALPPLLFSGMCCIDLVSVLKCLVDGQKNHLGLEISGGIFKIMNSMPIIFIGLLNQPFTSGGLWRFVALEELVLLFALSRLSVCRLVPSILSLPF